MTLIRHNERTGSKTPTTFAHDTEQIDVNGCFVPGHTGRQYTSAANPCKGCGGYGKLVAIQKVSRNEYPKGSVIPERYRIGSKVSSTEPVPSVPVASIPEPTPVTKIMQGSEPPHRAPHGAAVAVGSQGGTDPVHATDGSVPVGSVPTAPVATDKAADAISQLLATLVPDMDKITADIANATETVRADMLADVEQRIANLLVPQRVEVVSQDKVVTQVAGTVNPAFNKVLTWLGCRMHVYLVGPAGCGKTTLARQAAEALGVPFYTTGQVLSSHQVEGFVDAGGTYHPTAFRQAYEHGGLWLADEIDAWDSEALLTANAALANGHATFPDSPHPVKAHSDFYVIAAANTFGHGADRVYVGRVELDGATLDRFIPVEVGYDKALEAQIAEGQSEWLDLVWRVRANAASQRVRVVVSTRAVTAGVRGLRAGLPFNEVANTVLRRDMDDTTWEKVSK
jgi:energy-coupling factor transporter ATP-binding protein EcfA2